MLRRDRILPPLLLKEGHTNFIMDKWVVTGAAGFIGSNLATQLLSRGKTIVGVDNFSTGTRKNIKEILLSVSPDARRHFTLIEGDIRSPEICLAACKGASVILHHAAIASVPRSMENPREALSVNSDGFLNILEAARFNGCRVVYASSSAVYGDHPSLPKEETSPTVPLSPYGLSKLENELRASLYWRLYGVSSVGLRYFNIYGPRQDPEGAYAAVIAAWFEALRSGNRAVIHGDGSNTRDFCFVEDVVQANILAGTSTNTRIMGEVFNIATGVSVTLLGLFETIRRVVGRTDVSPLFASPRTGDILHSAADISKAQSLLGYRPRFSLEAGLRQMYAG